MASLCSTQSRIPVIVHQDCLTNDSFSQSYYVSSEAEFCIPVTQKEVGEGCVDLGKFDPAGELTRFDASSVVEARYSYTGILLGIGGDNVGLNERISTQSSYRRGIANFVQLVVVSKSLEAAIPVIPGQTVVHLADGDVYQISPDEVWALFYAERGLIRFSLHLLSQRVIPGFPDACGIPTAVVACRVVDGEAYPLSLSSAVKLGLSDVVASNLSICCFDETGNALCYRRPGGGMVPNALKAAGAPQKIVYVYQPNARSLTVASTRSIREPIRIIQLSPKEGPMMLSSGQVVNASISDVVTILLDHSSDVIGGCVVDRRPSLIVGNDFGAGFGDVRRLVAGVTVNSSSPSSHMESRNSPSLSKSKSRHSITPANKVDKDILDDLSSCDLADEDCRAQAYFLPPDLDFAIPIGPTQSSVRLTDGTKVRVDKSRILTVQYDSRGLACTTTMNGRTISWIPKIRGIGVKFQDFCRDPALVSAIPVASDQDRIVMDDGSELLIEDSAVTTIFYSEDGKPIFHYASNEVGRQKLNPGGPRRCPGVASAIEYGLLIEDGNGDNFLVRWGVHEPFYTDPVTNRQERVMYDDVCVMMKSNGQILYTQLPDGSLVQGSFIELDDDQMTVQTHDSVRVRMPWEQEPSIYRNITSNNNARNTGNVNESISPMSIQQTLSGDRVDRSGRKANNKTPAAPVKNRLPSISSSRRQEVIERTVKKTQVVPVEKIVEVPELRVVERQVEVEQIEYVIKRVPVKKIVERPVETLVYIPKIETKIIEKIIEIPEIIEVEREEIIERKVKVDNFVDVEQDVVVMTTINPVVSTVENNEDGFSAVESIECLRIEPELVAVDVYIPRLVSGKFRPMGLRNKRNLPVDVSLAHYNSLVTKLNPHIQEYDRLPMIRKDDKFPMLGKEVPMSVHDIRDEDVMLLLEGIGFLN